MDAIKKGVEARDVPGLRGTVPTLVVTPSPASQPYTSNLQPQSHTPTFSFPNIKPSHRLPNLRTLTPLAAIIKGDAVERTGAVDFTKLDAALDDGRSLVTLGVSLRRRSMRRWAGLATCTVYCIHLLQRVFMMNVECSNRVALSSLVCSHM